MSATRVPALIGDSFRESDSEEVDPIYNPATGETIALLPYSTDDEISQAIQSAGNAFGAWANASVFERAQVMYRFKSLLERDIEDLARTVTRENGKTLDESRGEVRRGIEVVDFSTSAPTLTMGTNLDQVSEGIDQQLVRFPVGVVAGVTPFNFPNMVPLWMIPIALVCGNTFVLKPSERTPLSAIRIGELLIEAGLPSGVFNIVHGGKRVVDALLHHPDVNAISFVGSARTASYIYSTAASRAKRVQALGGAKNHLIVMDDGDLTASVPAIISSAFGNAGQRCLAGSVVVGVGSGTDSLVSELVSEASALKLGPGEDPETEMGPVIRDQRRKELEGYIAEGEDTDATLVLDGRGIGPSQGYFLGATIFDDVSPGTSIWQEELFGPVLSVVRASDIDEALTVLNSSSFGNMASIFTSSGRNAREFRRRAEAGMLGVNIGVAAPNACFPFTGWKNSFFGDLHATGADSFRFYTRHKVVTTRWFHSETGRPRESA